VRIQNVRIGVALSIVALVSLLFPFESTVIPAAVVRIVDEAGNPVPHLNVKQEWHDVTVEAEQHVEVVKTNENGIAAFPTRKIRSFLLKRITNTVWRVSTQGIHASIGSDGAITAYAKADPHLWGWVSYRRNGDSWPEQIQLKRWHASAYPD